MAREAVGDETTTWREKDGKKRYKYTIKNKKRKWPSRIQKISDSTAMVGEGKADGDK